MVAVEARRLREQSEVAETGRFADGFHWSVSLVHLGVSYAQHKLVSRGVVAVESSAPSWVVPSGIAGGLD